jgi:hypothetical protein
MCLLPRSFLWRMTYDVPGGSSGEGGPVNSLIEIVGSALLVDASRSCAG